MSLVFFIVISIISISIVNFVFNILLLDILLNIRVDYEVEGEQALLRVSLLDLVKQHYQGALLQIKDFLDWFIIFQVDLLAWTFNLDLQVGLSEETNKIKYLARLLFLLYILPQRWLLEMLQEILEPHLRD